MVVHGKSRARLLIDHLDWAITVDRDRRMIANAAIAIAEDRIVAIGASTDVHRIVEADEIIDGRGQIALPGFIDCSVSTVHQFGRGLADNCDIYEYHLGRRLVYEYGLTEQDAYWASQCSQLEMIRSGTTCFVDAGSAFPNQVAASAIASGLRAFVPRSCADVSETFFGPIPSDCETTKISIERASASIAYIDAQMSPRVKSALAIPWMAACSNDLCERVASLGERAGALLIVAAGVSRDDAVASRREHFATEVERLRISGILRQKTLVAGGGWVSPADMATLRNSGVSVVCTPSSSHRLGTGSLEYGRYPELLAFGVNVALGSGSAMASNHTDIVRQLFLFCGANMSLRLDATVTPPEAALEMVTIRAAKAVGLEHEIGSLEVGKKADLSLFPIMRTDWIPLINPLENLAFSTRGGADTLIVDGRVLMSKGTVLSIDETETLRECQSRASGLAVRTGLLKKSEPKWSVV